MQKTLVVASLLSALSVTSLAHAQATSPVSTHTVTGNMTLASEYIFRGIGQTNRKPAIQGGLDYAHASGAYAGLWASSLSFFSDGRNDVNSSIEMDFYGGYKGAVGPLSYDVGVLQYYYPGTYPSTNYTDPDTLEVYAGLGWKWFTLKYSHALSNAFGAADSKNSTYVDLTGNLDIGHGITLTGHVGHQKIKNFSAASYTDWKVGVTKDMAGLTWGLAYIDTNAKGAPGEPYNNAFGKDLGKDRFLATVGKTF